VGIGDRDRGVVEGGADVCDSFGLDDALGLLSGSHLLRNLLLARDRAARPLLGAGVRMCTLTTDRQPATVAIATVRADVHQSLDVRRDLGAKGAFDADVFLDRLAEAVRVGIVQILDALVGADPGVSEDLSRCRAADAVDVCQPDLELLLARKIHAGDTCHLSALPLLVLRVALADDADHALALDHLAVLTDWFDAAAYFHSKLLWTCEHPREAAEV